MPAEIRIGRYQLSSDAMNWMVHEIKTFESGKRIGETYLANPHYYGTLEQALNGLLSQGLRDSEARTLQDLKDEMNLWRGEVLAALGIRI